MKCILVLITLLSTDLIAQDTLYKSIPLVELNRYNKVNEVRENNENKFYAILGDRFIYRRKDSMLMAHKWRGNTYEFLLPIDLGYNPNIYKMEFLEGVGKNLWVLDIEYYFSKPVSMWNTWFCTYYRTIILDLENHKVSFDMNTQVKYSENVSIYEQDPMDEELSEKEREEIFENATTDEFYCGYHYELKVTDGWLHINPIGEVHLASKEDLETRSSNVEFCVSSIQPGKYSLSHGTFVRKK